MKITFLGTGTSQGIPVIACKCEACLSNDPRDNRLRTSIHIQINNVSVVIDIGPDFRQQMLTHQIEKLDAILLTHEHNDHVIGLDDVRPYNFRQKEAMKIFAEFRVHEELETRFAYIFTEESYPGQPKIQKEIIGLDPFSVETAEFIPIRLIHGRMPILGFRIGNFCYLTDASDIPSSEVPKIKGINVLVLNALRHSKHWSHFTLDEAVEWIRNLNPKSAYLTHISHLMGPTHQWEKELPEGIYPAYDGLVLEL